MFFWWQVSDCSGQGDCIAGDDANVDIDYDNIDLDDDDDNEDIDDTDQGDDGDVGIDNINLDDMDVDNIDMDYVDNYDGDYDIIFRGMFVWAWMDRSRLWTSRLSGE